VYETSSVEGIPLNYSIEGVVERFPGINIGVLRGEGLKITKTKPELDTFKLEALRAGMNRIGSDPISQHPYIASWRNLYRSFGTKAADFHSSTEALVRRAIKTQQLPQINTAVDTYNAVSIKHLVPMGGFDTDHVVGDISLRFSSGNEAFTGLGSDEREYTYPGEVVYTDAERILTRRWNYRDCVETMITEKTVNLVMFIDGSPETPRVEVDEALKELLSRLQQYCGGSYSRQIANSETPVVDIL
jgi:DNA/RNA-binding domain of Phe-tRNA-synthetase-like protein